MKQVGRELGVRYVLEGSVRKSANRVRITGQLIDANTGAIFGRSASKVTLDDVFELQDRWPRASSARSTAAGAGGDRACTQKPTESLDAYDY